MAYLINHKNQEYIYIHIPRTGGTTVESLFNFNNCGINGHLTLQNIYDLNKELLNNKIIFSIVRNPWDWVVSFFYWIYNVRFDSDFIKEQNNLIENYFSNDIKKIFRNFVFFINERKNDLYFENNGLNTLKYQNHYDWLTIDNKLNSEIILFQNLKKDLKNKFNIDVIPKLNSIDHPDYKELFDNETKKIISKMFEKDIEYFKWFYENN